MAFNKLATITTSGLTYGTGIKPLASLKIQNGAGCADYCVQYAGKPFIAPIAIAQSGMCVLDNLECEHVKI
jgi:hypothetical protein